MTTHRRRAGATAPIAVGLATALVATLAGCGARAQGDDEATLTVFAAASLQGSFEQLAEQFEAAHDGVEVQLSFAGSSDLVAQIQQGAPADVFASADTATMDRLVADDLVDAPQDFASNTLEIAVPPGNPAGVETLADLAEVDLVMCAPEVPCGAAAATVEETAGLDLAPVSEERNVTDVLGKVIAGEAEAGLVYVTDVAVAGDDVEGIDFPESSGAVNTYPIATVAGTGSGTGTGTGTGTADLAQEFVDLVLGDEGRATLAELGFAAP